MAVRIIIENRGASIATTARKIEAIHQRMQRPDPTRAVKKVAETWGLSFKREGAAVGGWTALAQATVDERIRQGYQGDHPILIRQGSLYAMSVLFFMAGRPGRATATSTYGGRPVTTSANLSIADGTATLGLSGPKTIHQKGEHGVPERPYWFSTTNAVLAARAGVIEWISKEALENL